VPAEGVLPAKIWVMGTVKAGYGKRKTPPATSRKNGRSIGSFSKTPTYTGTPTRM